jgi:hypothetical protein
VDRLMFAAVHVSRPMLGPWPALTLGWIAFGIATNLEAGRLPAVRGLKREPATTC